MHLWKLFFIFFHLFCVITLVQLATNCNVPSKSDMFYVVLCRLNFFDVIFVGSFGQTTYFLLKSVVTFYEASLLDYKVLRISPSSSYLCLSLISIMLFLQDFDISLHPIRRPTCQRCLFLKAITITFFVTPIVLELLCITLTVLLLLEDLLLSFLKVSFTNYTDLIYK